ncbi:C2H2 and C2HC zinc finger [Venustampulla echinocandica]|uniref:C2H2 and C2HC zinc finger n=1 Tax=Venustampulla echinocandica TaxID=2656787 RepID=A0A370TFI0_9HELO|nr:C2H2 and C2HC zinc finger [Venustampulla echinocandica]RDL33655.1 C2H2 and C2HC zinc finger [Venustampulla echinocandica]
MQSMYGGSGTHTPRTPATPNTPGSANTMGNFPQIASQSRGYQMMPGGNYQQPQQPYRTSSSMMVQSSTAMSHPQPIAPAPAQNRMPQTLRPMPPNGLQHMHPGMSSPYGQGMMMLQEMEPPTHVVGSQGRRGILPSAPGRPAPAVTGTGSTKNTMIPAKDADGKFPCPHCTKTYLHAKHLKRHLLRHTGDRPYMCVLCRDTFSRSDILKRHFQKCSIRRGNPTGASHLSHAQAHLKKSHPGPHKPAPSMNDNDLMGMNGMSNMGHDPALHPFAVIPDGGVPDPGSNLTDEQAGQLNRTNSLKPLGNGEGGDRRSMAGVGPGGSSRTSFEQSYAGAIASTMPSGMNPSLAFNMPNGQNGHSYSQGYDFASNGNGSSMQPQSTGDISTLQQHPRNVYPGATAGQQHGLDWAQMFQPQTHDGYIAQYNPSTTISQPAIKPEPLNAPPTNNLFHGVYAGAVNGLAPTSNAPGWNLQNDPLHEISNRLLYYCFPTNQVVGRSSDLRGYLSADNIKHFLEHFTHFHGHFPIIHMPTFRIADAYDGLLLGMVCVGAVYSDRVSPTQVRDLMELAKSSMERNSPLFASQDQKDSPGYAKEAIGSSKSELEQITGIFLIQALFTWHGTPLQREKARRQFPMIAGLTRRAGLTTPTTTPPFSVLHQRHVKLESFNSTSFDWNAWVEQEKRSRLLYAIFVTDAAMVIYFNAMPLFDTREIRVPLPADDAAWDARTALECAEALGLHGPLAARDRNPEGSRRPKQPEMHSALETLMRPDLDLQPGTTNLFSKFLLVHALHVQLWIAQKQYSQESGQLNAHTSLPASGASTPLSQSDWVMIKGVDTPQSASSSGRATPIKVEDQLTPTHQLLQTINHAFDKWKKVWDEDMAVQYPPSSSGGYRRFGFCRDSVHFYCLSKYLIKNNRGLDWKLAPDQRFSQIMNLLKYVKSWVVSDTAKRGEELGSVSDIDNEYGVRDLTLDMAQLFKPINKHTDSPVAGVHTGGGMA